MGEMKRLGRYIIEAHLGSGAYADVYRAQDEVLRRLVALKLLKPALIADEEAFGRFMQEAQVAAQLFHPQIATVLDVGQAEGYYFIAMRYVDGPSLDRLLEQNGPLAWEQARKICNQIGQALSFAHGRGLVHRDVKPQNILVSPTEGAILTDFGLVRAMEASNMATRTGALLGTPPYIAPEVWQGQPATAAVDQYALACVLYEMLMGRVLFTGPSPWAIMQQHSSPPELPEQWPAGYPAELSKIMRRALAQSPDERYPDLATFMAALPVQAQPAAPAAPAQPIAEQEPGIQPAVEAAEQVSHAPLISSEAGQSASVRPSQASTLPSEHSHSPDSTRPIPEPGSPTVSTGSRIKLPGWVIALITLGGLALLAVCGLGAIWGLDWLSGSATTAVAVVSPTKTPRPPATATPKPTTRPTAKPTITPTATSDPMMPPDCTKTGQTWTSPVDGMTLVCVPAGDFLMGSTDADGYADDNEKPQHTVYLNAYWMDQTEVTNAMFAAFVTATSYRTTAEEEGSGLVFTGNSWDWVPGANWQNPSGPGSDLTGKENHPVVQVSWDDAAAYCAWVGRQLPSEAQWEKAARGEDGYLYPWGNQPPDLNRLNFNYKIGDTTTVGSYPDGASPYGALDMAGNVWEWTADWFNGDYYSSQTTWNNPAGPTSGKYRVVRGGSWYNESGDVRAAYRYGGASDRSYIQGIRCRLSAAP